MQERETRKIAFVGTCCVGKTTLMKNLRDKYSGIQGIEFVEEAAREFFENNSPTDRLSLDVQLQIQNKVLEKEQVAHGKNPLVIVCDRAGIDVAAYLRAAGNLEGSKYLLQTIKPWIRTYFMFALLDPRDVPYVQDAIRQEDEETREKIHLAFVELLEETFLPYTLVSGTVKERVKKVEEMLELSALLPSYNV